MSSPLLTELPYHRDSAALFESIADQPWAVFLDSGYPAIKQGRYDILSARPTAVLLTRGGFTELHTRTGTEYSSEDPFDLVRRSLQPQAPVVPGVPFCGGAIGYFGYDLGRRLERLPQLAEDDEHLPEMAIGIYDWALVVDHRQRRSWLVGQGRDPQLRSQWRTLVQRLRTAAKFVARAEFRMLGNINSNMDRQRYGLAFRRIKHYIHEGDCYQVNLAQRFTATTTGDPWLAYKRLRRINPAPYAAYLNTPHAQVLSASPERFLKVVGTRVETRPIKGTRPRAVDPLRDRQLAEALARSPKDRAENLMIVDLLRNDISKNCALGSVKVSGLFELQTMATVHHLVSTITGQLATGRDALHLLRGCFPGGSITGAPKLRAMQIIEELEPHRRGVYCGSIGYIGFDGAMDSNIVIRTMVYSKGRMSVWAGGGIVADSSLEGEYQESFDKAAALLSFMQQSKPLNHVGA
ncbi:MAG: aminodeoxychorismate synthase component I [Pseudomonadota bacterium]